MMHARLAHLTTVDARGPVRAQGAADFDVLVTRHPTNGRTRSGVWNEAAG